MSEAFPFNRRRPYAYAAHKRNLRAMQARIDELEDSLAHMEWQRDMWETVAVDWREGCEATRAENARLRQRLKHRDERLAQRAREDKR